MRHRSGKLAADQAAQPPAPSRVCPACFAPSQDTFWSPRGARLRSPTRGSASGALAKGRGSSAFVAWKPLDPHLIPFFLINDHSQSTTVLRSSCRTGGSSAASWWISIGVRKIRSDSTKHLARAAQSTATQRRRSPATVDISPRAEEDVLADPCPGPSQSRLRISTACESSLLLGRGVRAGCSPGRPAGSGGSASSRGSRGCWRSTTAGRSRRSDRARRRFPAAPTRLAAPAVCR